MLVDRETPVPPTLPGARGDEAGTEAGAPKTGPVSVNASQYFRLGALGTPHNAIEKNTMPRKKKKPIKAEKAALGVSIYPAWCKQCGNCVEFCPVKALEQDEWGFPRLAKPDKCTSCRLCEKLCPDFAISVGEPPVIRGRSEVSSGPPSSLDGSSVGRHHSPERVLPVLEHHQDEEEADRAEE